MSDLEKRDLQLKETEMEKDQVVEEADFSETEKCAFENFSLDENFVKAVKLTDSIINKLYNKPTTKEKVFPAVFIIKKGDINNLYEKIAQKLNLHDIRDTEFSVSILGTDDKGNKQLTEFNNIKEFMNFNDTKTVLTKLVILNWKTKLFINNKKNSISKIIGEEFNIEIAISSAPKDSSDEAYFIFNDYPIKSKGVVQVSVVHSNQVIADELIQHVSDFVDSIEDKRYKKRNFIFNYKRGIAQSAEKILGFSAIIPLIFLFFNINKCLDNRFNIIKLISLSLFLFIFATIFGNVVGEKIFDLLNKRKSTSWIITNDYSQKEFDSYKNHSNPVVTAFLLYLLPIILNIISVIITNNIGL